MILADTSIWVAHLKGLARARPLVTLLDEDRVLLRPWVLGELTLGGLGRSDRALMRALPSAPVASDAELLELVDARHLAGRGIGWVDAQLIASALLCGAAVWTLDAALREVARGADVAWE